MLKVSWLKPQGNPIYGSRWQLPSFIVFYITPGIWSHWRLSYGTFSLVCIVLFNKGKCQFWQLMNATASFSDSLQVVLGIEKKSPKPLSTLPLGSRPHLHLLFRVPLPSPPPQNPPEPLAFESLAFSWMYSNYLTFIPLGFLSMFPRDKDICYHSISCKSLAMVN